VFLNRGSFKNIGDAAAHFNRCLVVQAINETTDAAIIGGYIEDYKQIMAWDSLKKYDMYKSLAAKSSLYGYLGKSGIQSYDGFMRFFDEQIVLTSLSLTQSPGEAELFIKSNGDVAPIDYTAYNALLDVSPVWKALYGQYFKSSVLLAQAFDNAVAAQAAKEGSAGRVNGGGTGPAGKGGSVTVPPGFGTEPAAPPEAPPERTGFVDMGGAEWARESVGYLAEIGAVNGDGEGRFYPDRQVTREEFVKILISAWNLCDESARADFEDVPVGEWYYPYIATGVKMGIVNGTSAGAFGVSQNITRQDAAVILHRILTVFMLDFPDADGGAFADAADIDGYALEAVGKMRASGIINGYPDGGFGPKGGCTRAEAAVIIYRAFQYSKNNR
jgi:hypothetical protein